MMPGNARRIGATKYLCQFQIALAALLVHNELFFAVLTPKSEITVPFFSKPAGSFFPFILLSFIVVETAFGQGEQQSRLDISKEAVLRDVIGKCRPDLDQVNLQLEFKTEFRDLSLEENRKLELFGIGKGILQWQPGSFCMSVENLNRSHRDPLQISHSIQKRRLLNHDSPPVILSKNETRSGHLESVESFVTAILKDPPVNKDYTEEYLAIGAVGTEGMLRAAAVPKVIEDLFPKFTQGKRVYKLIEEADLKSVTFLGRECVQGLYQDGTEEIEFVCCPSLDFMIFLERRKEMSKETNTEIEIRTYHFQVESIVNDSVFQTKMDFSIQKNGAEIERAVEQFTVSVSKDNFRSLESFLDSVADGTEIVNSNDRLVRYTWKNGKVVRDVDEQTLEKLRKSSLLRKN